MALRIFILALTAGLSAQAGIITPITFGDFLTPTVVDFQSAPLGAISGTDPYFTSAGISSVSGTAGGGTDAFGVRTNASRALWLVGTTLTVVDPGAGGVDDNPSYEISLANPTLMFGLGTHDQTNLQLTLTFFSGASNVGTYNITTTTTDLFQFYISNTEAFDRVTISGDGGGYAIDNITFETAATVPEPGTIWLLSGAGLAAFLFRRKRSAVV